MDTPLSFENQELISASAILSVCPLHCGFGSIFLRHTGQTLNLFGIES